MDKPTLMKEYLYLLNNCLKEGHYYNKQSYRLTIL